MLLQKTAQIPKSPGGYSLTTTSVTDGGSLLFLFVEEAGAASVTETYRSGIGIFPKTRMEAAKSFRLLEVAPDGSSQTTQLPGLDITFPLVDAFPDGKILIVGPRCSWRSENDFDRNGIVYSPQTKQLSRILLGDGINRAYVDALGRIWVSYSDEGIFGNFGWGVPGPEPVGSAGLACFSQTGKKIWEYPVNEQGDLMADCYALNVSGADAAIFYYTGFPICRISSDFKLACWKTNLGGCHEFAISATEALFSGQYNDPKDVAYVGELRDGIFLQKPIQLLMPDGSKMGSGQFLGRGKSLYFFEESGVYRATLN